MTALSVDMPVNADPIVAGDWIATDAGSRYIVAAARPVQCRAKVEGCERCADQVKRWAVAVERQPRDEPIPGDVRVVNFHWHSRKKHGR